MKFNIIYADPPWSYKDKAQAGNRGAICKYPVLDEEELCKQPIGNIAADDCILFMWVTMPKLPDAQRVIDAWGFEFKTNAFTWVKQNKKTPSWFWGMGRWTRANAELCLLSTRGNPKRASADVHSIIESPIEGHSKKPDITRDKILEQVGDLPRVELFARQSAPGWHSIGNGIDGQDIRDVLQNWEK